MSAFCPRCGTEKGPFVKGFCVECFSIGKDFLSVPKEIGLEACRHCKKARFSVSWVVVERERLERFLLSKAKAKELSGAKTSVLFSFPLEPVQAVKFFVRGKIGAAKLSFEKECVLKLRNATCDKCSKLFGNYFEATVQFRFEQNDSVLLERRVLQAQRLFDLLKKKDSLASIVKMSFERNGVDLVVGSNKAAKKVVAIMGRDAKQKPVASKSLHSLDRQTSRNIYRYTYCLRF